MARRWLPGLMIVILLAYFGLRLHNLLVLPLFIDETLHAERAASVWRGSPLWFGANGKLLGAWWVALFYPFPAGPWLLRASVLLLTLVGAAAVLMLAKRVYGPAAVLYTGTLLIFAPMQFFFDRLSLADTTLHPMLALFILSLFYLMDHPRFRWRAAAVCGAALALAIIAKATALVIIPLPFIAIWILPRGWRLVDRLKALAVLLGTTLVIWLPLLAALRSRDINYLGVPISQHGADAGDFLMLPRLINNLAFLLDGLLVYFGSAPLLIAAATSITAIIARPRQGIVLAMAVGGTVIGVIVAGNEGVSMRYWLGILPVALALVGGGLAVFGRWRFGSIVSPVLLGMWVIFSALPFIGIAYTAPAALNLPAKDRLEYLEADSAGTMLPELAAYLVDEAAQQPIVVTAAISQCFGLSLYLPADAPITLDCPRTFAPEGRGAALDAHVAEMAAQHAHYYVIFERPGLEVVDAITRTPLQALAEFPRPGNLVTITVYQPAQP